MIVTVRFYRSTFWATIRHVDYLIYFIRNKAAVVSPKLSRIFLYNSRPKGDGTSEQSGFRNIKVYDTSIVFRENT